VNALRSSFHDTAHNSFSKRRHHSSMFLTFEHFEPNIALELGVFESRVKEKPYISKVNTLGYSQSMGSPVSKFGYKSIGVRENVQ
jgi:hypothetical protein